MTRRGRGRLDAMANFRVPSDSCRNYFPLSIFASLYAHLHLRIVIAVGRPRVRVCQAPYNFSKRNPEAGANWWPGRQCQFFEFNWCGMHTTLATCAGNQQQQTCDGHERTFRSASEADCPWFVAFSFISLFVFSFAQAYKEADEALAEQEKAKLQ